MAARDKEFMRLALQHATLAAELGFVPIGAVLVVKGEIVGWGHNLRHGGHDTLGHAELIALRMAAEKLGTWRLPMSTLYVTLEPCPMCAGAILQARLTRVVFGARDPKAGAVRSLYALLEDPRLNHQVVVKEGVCAAESTALLKDFFANLRK